MKSIRRVFKFIEKCLQINISRCSVPQKKESESLLPNR